MFGAQILHICDIPWMNPRVSSKVSHFHLKKKTQKYFVLGQTIKPPYSFYYDYNGCWNIIKFP